MTTRKLIWACLKGYDEKRRTVTQSVFCCLFVKYRFDELFTLDGGVNPMGKVSFIYVVAEGRQGYLLVKGVYDDELYLHFVRDHAFDVDTGLLARVDSGFQLSESRKIGGELDKDAVVLH